MPVLTPTYLCHHDAVMGRRRVAGGSPLKEGLSVSQSRLPEAVCFYALCLPVHRGADTRRTAVMSYRKNAREFHFAIPCTDSHIIFSFFLSFPSLPLPLFSPPRPSPACESQEGTSVGYSWRGYRRHCSLRDEYWLACGWQCGFPLKPTDTR